MQNRHLHILCDELIRSGDSVFRRDGENPISCSQTRVGSVSANDRPSESRRMFTGAEATFSYNHLPQSIMQHCLMLRSSIF